MALHDWRHLLWKKSLGNGHLEVSGEVYCRWLDFRYKHLEPQFEVKNLLHRLRETYFLVLVTNGPSSSQWEKIKRLRLKEYFDLILVSGDLEWEKPCERIFLDACAVLKIPPEECIMVGDKLETDILGGVRAGFRATVLISGAEPLDVPGLHIKPTWKLGDVTQLQRLLSSDSFHCGTEKPFFHFDAEDPETCTIATDQFS